MLLCAGEAKELGFRMLIGVLEPQKGAAVREMENWVAWMKEKTGKRDAAEAIEQMRVCGFTVCPPKGADLSQEEIGQELEGMLRLGYPTVLYQLPQITLNEMEPLTVQRLAQNYPNFYMFKDTSGRDAVIRSGLAFDGVFFVRGTEGDYEKWSALSGGCYDGFLLSSANTFGNRLSATLAALQTISEELYEACKIDGGNVFQRFLYITVPGIKNVSVMIVLLSFIKGAGEFTLPYVMYGRSAPPGKANLISILVYQTSFQTWEFGQGAAMSGVVLVIMLLLAILYMRLAMQEEKE